METIPERPIVDSENILLEERPKVNFVDDGDKINNENANLSVPTTDVLPKSPRQRTFSKFKKDKKPKNDGEAPKETSLQKYVSQNINMKEGGIPSPTTCYGNIQFKETTKRATGRFIRCAEDTDPEKLFNLFTEHWKVQKPRLLISITGGAMSFDLQPRLKKDFQEGLLKVASTPGAWVVSGGTNTGVMKLVGDANHGTNNVCIGIVTWGIVAKRDTLVPQPLEPAEDKASKLLGVDADTRRSGETFPYRLGSYLVHKGEAFLDYNHTHFVLVDDGSVGKWGREIGFRGKFEEYLIQHKPNLPKIPSVLLVLEGGPGTLDTVYEAVKNSIPCVIIEGSGRAADVLVYAINHVKQILELEEEGKSHDGLVDEIQETFNLNDTAKIMKFKSIVIKCIKKKEVFTIANMRTGMDTDDAILTALLKDKSTSPSHYEQMRLAILWDRVDLAETRIMSKVGGSWVPRPPTKSSGSLSPEEDKQLSQSELAQHELNELMIMALAMDKVGFVKLLLGYGVSIKSLLTKQILQFLYGFRRSLGVSTIRYENERVRLQKMVNPEKKYEDFFEHLQEYSDARRGKKRRDGIQEIKLEHVQQLLYNVLRTIPSTIIEEVVEIPRNADGVSEETATFKTPFRQLFIWAVFNNMRDMALMLWEFEDDAICKALIAAEITSGLIRNIRYSDLQDEVEKSLEVSFNTYQKLSLDLLDLCFLWEC